MRGVLEINVEEAASLRFEACVGPGRISQGLVQEADVGVQLIAAVAQVDLVDQADRQGGEFGMRGGGRVDGKPMNQLVVVEQGRSSV